MAGAQDYYEWLAASVGRYEDLARSLIKHKAEKGRVVEGVVKAALRAILPVRFSLGTGFIVTSAGHASPQLDVVIYDAFHNAPIILEGGVGLFPVECVYAFVEVKSKLDTDGVKRTAKAIGQIRSFAVEKSYETYATGGPVDKPVAVPLPIFDNLPPRSYVFALRSELSTDTLVETIKQSTESADAHIHALAVIETDLFIAQRPYKDPHEFDLQTGKVMAHFGASVLHGVQSMPMMPASMSKYLSH